MSFILPHRQASHRSQEPQDCRVQDDDGSGCKVARVQHQKPSQGSFGFSVWGPGHCQCTHDCRNNGSCPSCYSASAPGRAPAAASGALTQGQNKGRQRYVGIGKDLNVGISIDWFFFGPKSYQNHECLLIIVKQDLIITSGGGGRKEMKQSKWKTRAC